MLASLPVLGILTACLLHTPNLGLAPAMRAGGVLANGDYQVHRDFMDSIVDGRPLLYQLSDLDAVSPLLRRTTAIFTAQVQASSWRPRPRSKTAVT